MLILLLFLAELNLLALFWILLNLEILMLLYLAYSPIIIMLDVMNAM